MSDARTPDGGTGGTLTRTLWALSVPIVFAEVSETIVQFTDTAFLSRVGVQELAAVGLADAVFEISIVLTLGLVDGIQIIIARRSGEGRDRAVGETFNQGLLLIILLSFAFMIGLKVASPLVSVRLVETEDLGAAVDSFLQIAAYGIVFNSASLALSALFVALGNTRALVGATIALAVTNVGLDYVLIFGKLGFPELGLRGAAIGSVAAEIVAFAYLFVFALRRLDLKRYGLFQIAPWDWGLASSLARISSPVALQALIEAFRWFAFFLILERVSEQALALSVIVYACYAVFLIPSEGFAEAACSMVSQLIGRGEERRIGRLMRAASGPTYAITAPFVGLALVFPGVALFVLTSDPAMIESAAGGLRVVALTMLVAIPAQMWLAAVVGTGDTAASLVIEAAGTMTMLAGAYLAAITFGAGLPVIWMSLAIAWAVGLGLSWFWIRSEWWTRFEI